MVHNANLWPFVIHNSLTYDLLLFTLPWNSHNVIHNVHNSKLWPFLASARLVPLTLPGHQTWNPPLASDIWWGSLETCSNLFIWRPPGVTSGGGLWNWRYVISEWASYWNAFLLPTAREGNVFRGRPPPPGGDPLVLTSSGGHCSGWYASYWNAYL